jgi:predicted nucleic acid-binding OB-fold protein
MLRIIRNLDRSKEDWFIEKSNRSNPINIRLLLDKLFNNIQPHIISETCNMQDYYVSNTISHREPA